ncbi:MAG TPA: hypothetical protein VHE10_02515 [Candidatus Paceibacterota bacterium]|nr:hypothetical protein [Candidatus Paceibacterota bacterium]
MNDTFVLGQGQGHELEMALRRNDWTSALLKQATQGDFLAKVRLALGDKAMLLTEPVRSEGFFISWTDAQKLVMDIIVKHRLYYKNLGLQPGEQWLPTEPMKMTWFEAVEIAASSSFLRLPHYSHMISLAEHMKKGAECRPEEELKEGEYWTVCSEGDAPNKSYACCLTADHLHFESHRLKTELKWVKFVFRSPVN